MMRQIVNKIKRAKCYGKKLNKKGAGVFWVEGRGSVLKKVA